MKLIIVVDKTTANPLKKLISKLKYVPFNFEQME